MVRLDGRDWPRDSWELRCQTINIYQSPPLLHLPRMHPSQRIYCPKSEKLKGKRIVLGITGSIAAVEDGTETW